MKQFAHLVHRITEATDADHCFPAFIVRCPINRFTDESNELVVGMIGQEGRGPAALKHPRK